jgi:hypothetical protein
MTTAPKSNPNAHLDHSKSNLPIAKKGVLPINNWTAIEKEKMFKLHRELGNNWREIALYFPNKSFHVIKEYFEFLLRKLHKFIAKNLRRQKLTEKMGLTNHQCDYLLSYMIEQFTRSSKGKSDDPCITKLMNKKAITIDQIVSFKTKHVFEYPSSHEALQNCDERRYFEKNPTMRVVNSRVLPKLKTLIHYIRAHEREFVEIQTESNLTSIEQMLAASKRQYPNCKRIKYF